MRMINDLVVRGEPAMIAEFTRRIEAQSLDHWHRERETEERLKKMMADSGETYCFSKRDEAGRSVASLWFDRTRPDEFSVSNIIPAGHRSLTDAEYNGILEEFEIEFLRPMSQGLDIEPRIIPPALRLEESLNPETITALRTFSGAANKSMLHPLDLARWNRLIVQAHRRGSTLDGPDLDWWLEEEGWPEPQRRRLLEAYETGLSLLAEYDEERVSP